MTSSIEKAAQRLEQLRKAGAPVPGGVVQPAESVGPSTVEQPAQTVAPAEDAVLDVRRGVPTSKPVSKSVHIDLTALAAAGFITPNAPRSAMTDQFRVIKRPLLENATGKGASLVANGNLIMVTSSLPGEGKTFTAINLAMSLAMELNHTVMLVDADVARQSIMQTMGLPPAPGLLDLLLDDRIGLPDVLLRTNIDNFTLLPTGLPNPRATELLASDAMVALLNDMGKRYRDRIIIFDSPPLLLTTEARVLASHMGQVVIVVQAEKTLQSQVQHALSAIEACPIRLMVLNQARSRGLGAYGYGYGHGYGYDQLVGEPSMATAAA
ncbi:chromosome partitioning ATPase [Acidovorax carolinensis]|uniref:non-specific protein-tyrosine kinase n=1 Tax=Acidovorax carolinensis TaxID=553814 RepID=A0A240UH52_9BURK|nr:XrtA-associated tyrosine autokinase [Acidovorax carolinensis]ART54003.1 chromosome partitioning ATPase [Acidovorax carolinensis]ART60382.1 chromosome partitioning ATPase [Acidovorax carolinensis]